MNPNFYDGDYFFVDELAYASSLPQRGDVVLFKSPTSGDQSYVKRVIGLPGETIEVRNHKIYINGSVLNEPYSVTQMDYTLNSQKIPGHQYFVLGDNRNNSSDSHSWGPITGDSILGRVTFIYAPSSQQRIVPQYVFTDTTQ